MSVIVRLLSLFFDLLEYLFSQVVNTAFKTSPTKNKAYSAHFISPAKLLSKKNKGFCLNGTHNLSLKHSFQHAMIIGGSGVGKSSTVLIPSLYTMEGSFVVHDPSGELHKKTAKALQRKNYIVLRLNFANPNTSIRINPLHRANTSSEINKLASLLIRSVLGKSKEPFWNIQGVSLISMLIGITRTLEPNYQTLHTVRELLLLLKSDPEHVDQLASKLKDQSLLNVYKAFIGFETKIQTSIIATGLAALSIFADDEIMQITGSDNFSWENLKTQKTALFIQTPIKDQQYYQPLINIIFEQLFGALMDRLPNPNDLPVFLLIDEAASLFLPSLSVTLANLRKYNCGIMLVLQDFEQLVDVYGQAQARIMKTNCFSKLYFTGQALETAKELEQILGIAEYRDQDGRPSNHPLLTNDAIRTLSQKKAILICGHFEPMLVKLRPYYRRRRWTFNIRLIEGAYFL